MDKYGLAFSGGKDSWACLWLNQARLHEITVLWVNTGKCYPELLANVEQARAMCPNFVEIKTDQAAQNAAMGIPSDVVPIRWTRLGMVFGGPKPTMVQSYLDCCMQNISMPLHAKVKELGITRLIRGQRSDECHTSPAGDETVFDGVTFMHPIESWTSQQVLDYVASKMPLPAHFALRHTSMDCYDCTAYRAETRDRVEYTRVNHPDLHQQYLDRDSALRHALVESMT